EAILAIEATRTFSKKQILEMYFNQIYYGNQAYGLKAAAATYFGIADLNKLTLAQMALLAGLPQAPSDYDPIQNMPAAMARRAQVLDAMVDNVNALHGNNVNNAALITMDPSTGEILAYVGSYDYYVHTPKVQGDYDHAGIALRQPGSTFKLFTYLTGMQKLGLTASSRLYDIQFTMQDGSGKPYSPKDSTKEQHGPLTLRQALRESLNLPALEVTRLVGVDSIIDTVHQLGINRDWDRTQLGLSFGIGAGEMRLIDMASAYQVIANLGVRVDPTFIYKVVDPTGKVVK